MNDANEFFVSLDSPLALTARLVGSKAANLAKLKRSGYAVPDGFCLTFNAREFFERTGTPNLKIALRPWLERLVGGTVFSVRSSAADEDLAHSSAAGQYLSIIGVSGLDEICDAIIACWHSAQSVTAEFYRSHRGVGAIKPQIGVLIHNYIAAEYAGVIFTADPVTSTADLIVEVQQSPGRPSGTTTYKTNKAGSAERVAGDFDEGSFAPAPTYVLEQLCKIGRQIEEDLGHPCDIEWVLDKNRVWIVQTRPISTLTKTHPIDDWTRCNIGEVVPERMTPLSYSVWAEPMEQLFQLSFRHFNIRADRFTYIKSRSGFLWYNIGAVNYLSNLIGMPPVSSAIGFRPKLSNDGTRSTGVNLFRVARNIVGLARATSAHARLGKRIEAATPQFRRIASTYAVAADNTQNPSELLSLIIACYAELKSFLYLYADATSASFSTYALLETAVSRWMDDSINPASLLKTSGVELAGIAEILALLRNPQSRKEDRIESEAAFIERFGHRGWQELELSNPTWREWGAQMLGRASAFPASGGERFSTSAKAQVKVHALDSNKKNLIFWRKHLIADLAERASKHSTERENVKHELYRPIDTVRSMFRKIAKILVGDGALAGQEDMYFLTMDEIKKLIATREAHLGRVAAMRRRASKVDTARIEEPKSTATLLRGIGASPGQAIGQARIRRSPSEAMDIAPGDILVAEALDIGWVPLFPLLGGIITKMGGILSHPCIIAREFKLPMVVGVANVMRDVDDGTWVSIDGDKGTIELLPT